MVNHVMPGTGPKRTAMWLDGEPGMVVGFHGWPKVGNRLVIDGWRQYRVVTLPNCLAALLH